ncbi:MAG: aminotransferase class IV [Coriobacteriia bacterium]|nr:aminotransferase class IV [Coriobacteriia bacterium]
MRIVAEIPRSAASSGWPPESLRETGRVARDRTVPLWPYHRRRLGLGGCGEAVLEAVDAAVADALARLPAHVPSRTRLTVVVSCDGGGAVRIERRLSSLDVPGGIVGVPVTVDAVPLLPPSAAKPADRSFWDDAQRAAVALGGHQAVLVSRDGEILDGSTATVVLRFGALALTPPSPPAIAGVGRAWLLDNAARLKIDVAVRRVTRADFEAADEIVYLNAYGGARADARKGSALAEAIQRNLDGLWNPRRGYDGRGCL